MAKKTLPASTGYFNEKMLKILEQGESKPSKTTATAKNTTVKNAPKSSTKPKSK